MSPTRRRHTVRKVTAEMPTFNRSSSPVTFRTFNAHCSRCGRQTVGHIGAPAEAGLATSFIVWCHSCAETVERLCKSIIAELQNPSKDDPIHGCGEEDLRHGLNDDREIDRLFKLADKKLHVYPFNGVKMCWFRLYTDTSIAKALKKIPGAQVDIQHNAMPVEVIDEIVSILDMALIMAGGVGRKEIIHSLLKELEAATEPAQDLVPQNFSKDIPDDPNRSGERPAKRRKLDSQPNAFFAGSLTDEDYDKGDTTEREDWASGGTVGHGAKRLPPSGVDSSGFTPPVGDSLQRVPSQSARPDNGNVMVTISEPKPVAIADNQDDRLLVETVSVPSISHPVLRLQTPSLSDFQKYMDVTAKPLVLTGAMQHWPALDRWNSKSYWLSKTFRGKRLVPIEIGRSYLDDGWGQKIVPFGTFLSDYLLDKSKAEPSAAIGSHSGSSPLSSPPDSDEESITVGSKEEQIPQASAERCSGSNSIDDEKEKGYLAQHDLLSQIPSLRSDVATPDYCFLDAPPPKEGTPVALKLSERRTKQSTHLTPGKASDLLGLEINDSDDGGTTNDIQSNIWFGPAWTITPLHHDSYHNILCQVVGKKYIRLYAPEHSQRLYPRGWEEAAGSRAAARELPDEGRVVGQEQGKAHLIDMSNNSSVDVADMELSPAEDWDALWPGISNVPYVECILDAGEALYIPIGWWHYVRGCSIGISVSFWW